MTIEQGGSPSHHRKRTETPPIFPRDSENSPWILNFDLITISGPSGTGKTRIAELLQREYSIQNSIKAGQIMRDLMNTQETVGPMRRKQSLDKRLDRKTIQHMYDAHRKRSPQIIEARLAGIIAQEEETIIEKARTAYPEETQNTPPLRAVRIILYGDLDVRAERIHKRHLEEDPTLTLDQTKEATREREEFDQKQWVLAHPEYEGIEPFDPKAQTKDKQQIYTLAIDTTNLPLDSVMARIRSCLIENNLVERKPEPLPKSTDLSKEK